MFINFCKLSLKSVAKELPQYYNITENKDKNKGKIEVLRWILK